MADKEWYIHGKRHREGGLPACEYADGSKEWYMHGRRHREGGLPAMEYANGYKAWYMHGKRHREGGLPAIEGADGSKWWWVHNQLHREGGLPAMIHADGTKGWYVNNTSVTQQDSMDWWQTEVIEKRKEMVKKALPVLTYYYRRYPSGGMPTNLSRVGRGSGVPFNINKMMLFLSYLLIVFIIGNVSCSAQNTIVFTFDAYNSSHAI